MDIPGQYLVHVVDVEPLAGTGAYGEVYGPVVPLRCFAEGSRRMVRNPQGEVVVSSLTLICAPRQANAVPAGSRITWRGTTTTVIDATDRDDAGLGAPQHTEVVCE